MLIIKIDHRGIFITDLWQDQWDQIRLSIMAARVCGFQNMQELANELHITARSDKGMTIINLSVDEVVDLLIIMSNMVPDMVTKQTNRALTETIEALDCALEMGTVK